MAYCCISFINTQIKSYICVFRAILKKHTRCEIRSDAAKLLAPQFNPINNIEEINWVSTGKAVALSTITTDDTKDLHAMSFAISRANANQAASALTRLLNDRLNLDIKAGGLQETITSKDDNLPYISTITLEDYNPTSSLLPC